jgi:RHS repeat-associated protein
VKYRYDAYGNILGLVDNSTGDIISKMNPYTYRGYRYDSEIGYYYLNSRYYNPEIGRFINADGMLGEMGDIPSTNMYAYCASNPVMNVDPNGTFVITLTATITLGSLALVALASLTVYSIIRNKEFVNEIDSLITAVKTDINKKNIGTYTIKFNDDKCYVGKGSLMRAKISAFIQSVTHLTAPIMIEFIPAPNDREAFKNEYIEMVKHGFNTPNSDLYNIIWSPGRRYYYEDNGRYYPGDIG